MPYVLPALPAVALLGAGWLAHRFSVEHASRILLIGLGFVVVIVTLSLVQLGRMEASGHIKSTKVLIETYQSERTQSDVLVYLGKRPFSANFYLRAPIEKMMSAPALADRLRQGSVYAIVDTNQVSQLQKMMKQPIDISGHSGNWSLVTTRHLVSTTSDSESHPQSAVR